MTVICITGMHRSGTSMITRMLNLCGLYLGEEQDLLPAMPDNPEGFWENRKFMEINDAILSFFGGSWHTPPDPGSIFNMQHDLSFLEEQAKNLIGGFANQTFWGWKDPRNSLTFPFWQGIIPGLKVIICLRNPVEVAQSLVHRNQFSEIFSLNLWQTYNQRLMTSVAPAYRLITHYNTYFAEPETELRRLLEFMNIKVDNDTIRGACQATLSSLRHNRAAFGNLIETGAPLDVANLYAEMCSQAGHFYLNTIKTNIRLSSANNERFDPEIEQNLLSKFMGKDPLVQLMAQWSAEKQRQIELLAEQISKEKMEKEQTVQLLHTQLTEKEQTVQALTTQAAEKEQAKQALISQLAEKEQAIQVLAAQIAETEGSRAWKALYVLRRIKAFLVPHPKNSK